MFPMEPSHDPLREKGDSPHLPERPGGCFAQMGTVPFFVRDYAEQYCDGTLSADDTAALERRLRDDPQAMEFFVLYMEVHSQIAWNVRAHADEESEVRNADISDIPNRAPIKGRATSLSVHTIGGSGLTFDFSEATFQ